MDGEAIVGRAKPVTVKEEQVVVIGAGPSGLAAADALHQAGLRPVILERSGEVGGLMRSIRHGVFTVDLGRKELYTRIPEVDALWRSLLGEDYRAYPHRVGSLYGGHILEMSSSYRGVRRGMPVVPFLAGAADLAWSWAASSLRAPANYEQYWHRRAGRRFARSFAQTYWEKFRGQRWRDMPVPVIDADGRQTSSHSFGAIAHGLKLAVRGGGTSQRLWQHPARGSGQICERLAERLRLSGVEIEFDTEVVGIRVSEDAVVELMAVGPAGQIRYRPQHLISSLQVEAFASLLEGAEDRCVPGRTGPNRCVVLVYLFLDEPPRFPHAWLEVNDTGLTCGRITNYAAFNGDMVPAGKTALCVEFFLNGDDPALRRSDGAWMKLAVEECTREGLIDPSRIIDTLTMTLDRCNAAASWREAQEAERLRLLQYVSRFRNFFHVNRPGTDWATYAGLLAAQAVAAGVRRSFDTRADPTRSYAESQLAA